MTQRKKTRRRERPVKAYRDPGFLGSRDARVIRILAEYLEPLQRFRRMGIRETVVFFGSARARPPASVKRELAAALEERKRKGGNPPQELQRRIERLEWKMKLASYYDQAAELSALITRWSRSLKGGGNRFVVCSGGGPGIMEGANRGATERGGGLTAGLAISLPKEEAPNPYITPSLMFDFHYFFMRKLWFMYLATALVIFPGGFGTMDEMFEILTLVQTRKIDRPLPIVLYGTEFWNEFLDFDTLVRWGTIGADDLKLFKFCDSPKEAFEYLKRELLKHYPRMIEWDARRGS